MPEDMDDNKMRHTAPGQTRGTPKPFASCWTAVERMTASSEFYARHRADVIATLEADAPKFIATLALPVTWNPRAHLRV